MKCPCSDPTFSISTLGSWTQMASFEPLPIPTDAVAAVPDSPRPGRFCAFVSG